jgi:hypothetical protein
MSAAYTALQHSIHMIQNLALGVHIMTAGKEHTPQV